MCKIDLADTFSSYKKFRCKYYPWSRESMNLGPKHNKKILFWQKFLQYGKTSKFPVFFRTGIPCAEGTLLSAQI